MSRLRIALALAAVSMTFAETEAQPSRTPVIESCDAMPGGFMVPGSNACLKIGGRVSASYSALFAQPSGMALADHPNATLKAPARSAISGSNIDTAVSVDVRAQTELGPVRAYVSLRRPRTPLP